MRMPDSSSAKPAVAGGVRAALTIALALAAGAAPASRPATAPAAGRELAARVEEVLRGLEAEAFAEREAATAALEQLPAEAVPLLEARLAAGDGPPEVAARIESRISLLRRKGVVSHIVRQQDRELEYVRDTTDAAYTAGGHTDRRWDDAARKALRLSIRPRWSRTWTTRDSKRALDALRQATALGCGDPLVRYHESRLAFELEQLTAAEALERMTPAVEALVEGKAAGWLKIAALAQRARLTLLAEEGPASRHAMTRVETDVEAALQRFAGETGKPDFPPGLRMYLAESLCDHDSPRARWNYARPASAKLVKAIEAVTGPDSAQSLLFRGWYELSQVQRARQDADEKDVRKHLDEARRMLDASWQKDSKVPAAATLMLFTLAEQGAARDEVERWFERAVEHNPWNYDAHWHRTRYLLRHVSAGDALEFARQTRASNDWQGRLPFVLVDAHLLAAGFRAHQRFNEHLADPAVWAEVSQVYEEYLKRYPGSARDRSSYANFAARAGKWDVAARQLEILGADAVMERFNGRQDYDYLKRKAAAGAGGEDRK